MRITSTCPGTPRCRSEGTHRSCRSILADGVSGTDAGGLVPRLATADALAVVTLLGGRPADPRAVELNRRAGSDVLGRVGGRGESDGQDLRLCPLARLGQVSDSHLGFPLGDALSASGLGAGVV